MLCATDGATDNLLCSQPAEILLSNRMPRHVREPQRAGKPQNKAMTTIRVWSIHLEHQRFSLHPRVSTFSEFDTQAVIGK
jgi:hypothetical protein